MDIIQEAKSLINLDKNFLNSLEIRMVQALSRLVDRLEWKPIETALKQTYDEDGEFIEILLMEECGNIHLGYWNDDTKAWIDSGGIIALDDYTDFEQDEKHVLAEIAHAKYWLPLPPVGGK